MSPEFTVTQGLAQEAQVSRSDSDFQDIRVRAVRARAVNSIMR